MPPFWASGAIQDELALDDEGNVVKKQVMRLSVTLDHRLLDGRRGGEV